MEKEIKVTSDVVKKSKLLRAQLDHLGREINNPVPAFIPAGPTPLTITEQIQRLLRVELSRQAAEQGFETFEESDDMEDEELDDAPLSPYQDEKLMRPDRPKGEKISKKADLDLELPDDDREVQEPASVGGGGEETPPRKPLPKGKKG